MRRASQPGVDYSQVIAADLELNSFLETLPIYLKYDGYSENLPEVIYWMKERPYLQTLRDSFHCMTHGMRLQLHQSFMASGYRSSVHRASTDYCLKASHFVIGLLLNTPASSREAKFFRHSRFFLPDDTFFAASVLLVHLLQPHVTVEAAERTMEDVDTVIDFIQSFVEDGFVSNHGRMVAALRNFKDLVISHRRSFHRGSRPPLPTSGESHESSASLNSNSNDSDRSYGSKHPSILSVPLPASSDPLNPDFFASHPAPSMPHRDTLPSPFQTIQGQASHDAMLDPESQLRLKRGLENFVQSLDQSSEASTNPLPPTQPSIFSVSSQIGCHRLLISAEGEQS